MSESLAIRLATSEDQAGIIQLIRQVYQEYGETICLDGADSDLLDIQSNYFDCEGAFWVLVDPSQKILGTHAAVPILPTDNDPDELKICYFRRLYLDSRLRGSRWGHRLMQITLDWAGQNGFARVEFWSDTRFARAHRFFQKFDFTCDGTTRTMYDGVEPYTEYFFFRNLAAHN